MQKRSVPCLMVGSPVRHADIRYATGFAADASVVLLVTAAGQYLVVPRLEKWRARSCAAGTEVLAPDDLRMRMARRRDIGHWAVALLRAHGIRRVSVPGSFPIGVARRLRRAGVSVSVARGEMFPQRRIKTVDELQKMKAVQQAAVIAMRWAISAVASAQVDSGGFLRLHSERLTSERMRCGINSVLLQHGCFCRDVIVAGGTQSANPHEPGRGPLKAHEPIVIDIFPQHSGHGYWGDLTRTVARGGVSSELRRMYHAVKAAQASSLNAVRPGASASSIHGRAVAELEARGFFSSVSGGAAVGFVHSSGHGIGLDTHEPPAIGQYPGRLRVGNVITIEPGLYYPDLGGIRIEDTVLVTASGWQYLAPCEKKFEV